MDSCLNQTLKCYSLWLIITLRAEKQREGIGQLIFASPILTITLTKTLHLEVISVVVRKNLKFLMYIKITNMKNLIAKYYYLRYAH